MKKLIARAFYLAIFTIVYNIAEGVISIFFGLEDETLALFGFGVDSFVEVISGIGILHMIIRMRKHAVDQRDKFERTALRITGFSFFLLAAGLIFGSIINTNGNGIFSCFQVLRNIIFVRSCQAVLHSCFLSIYPNC